MFVKLSGRRCLVVGAGSIGEAKIESLLRSGADVTVVSPQVSSRVAEWISEQAVCWHDRPFRPEDLEGMFLVVAATSRPEVNKLVYREATQRHVLCNAVDDPEHCDFFYPAVVRRGALQIAISTAGHSPALAQRLRCELEQQFSASYGSWLEELAQARQTLLACTMDAAELRLRLHDLASRQSFVRFQQRSMRGPE
jgi:precorrin-2 dehydrogenase/sirohydrochlorin ferrochelatase